MHISTATHTLKAPTPKEGIIMREKKIAKDLKNTPNSALCHDEKSLQSNTVHQRPTGDSLLDPYI